MFCIFFTLQNKWAVTLAQLIALLYKDQHVVTLQKLLNLWLEASLSDSSEDDESNTSSSNRGIYTQLVRLFVSLLRLEIFKLFKKEMQFIKSQQVAMTFHQLSFRRILWTRVPVARVTMNLIQ